MSFLLFPVLKLKSIRLHWRSHADEGPGQLRPADSLDDANDALKDDHSCDVFEKLEWRATVDDEEAPAIFYMNADRELVNNATRGRALVISDHASLIGLPPVNSRPMVCAKDGCEFKTKCWTNMDHHLKLHEQVRRN
jgi:hypothetical protein